MIGIGYLVVRWARGRSRSGPPSSEDRPGDDSSAAADAPESANQFEATIVWMDEHELLPGRGYWLKIGTKTATATDQMADAPSVVDAKQLRELHIKLAK